MSAERIDGIKYHIEKLQDEELENIRGYLVLQHSRLTDDIELVETEIHRRRQEKLPFVEDDGIAEYEHMVGHAVVYEALPIEDALVVLDNYEQGAV